MVFGLIFRVFTLFFFFAAHADHLSNQIEQVVSPYLLPSEHPLKSSLDQIFTSSRVTFNFYTLEKAGFQKSSPRKFTKMIVTHHPECSGYIFKLYLDTQRYHKDRPEYELWVLRAKGADVVREKIISLGLENLFKVPKKWIYPLPETEFLLDGYYPRHYILVEEDMQILSSELNKKLWASDAINHQLLDYVIMILNEAGLYDCAKPDNIPFSTDGRIAFVDTETFGSKKVIYKKMIPYLSPDNQRYWKSRTKNPEILFEKTEPVK